MSSSDRHRDCRERRYEDLAAYALGALDPREIEGLEAHLEHCPHCEERLDWLLPAVNLMPASVEQLAAPPQIGERLMAIVNEEAAAQSELTGAETPAPASAPSVKPARLRWLPRNLSLRPALAGFATLIVLVAAIGGYIVRSDDDGGARTYAALPETPRLNASGTVKIEDGTGLLTTRDLPPIPQNEVYQVWVSHDDQLEPSSLFVLDHDGTGSTTIPNVPEDADAIMVTRERSGGAEAPTTGVVLRAQLD